MKKVIYKIYYCFVLSKEKANLNQKKARDIEWDSIKTYIKQGLFLDVGCGAWLNQNPDKILFVPKYFLGFKVKKEYPINIIPNNWIQVDVYE